jgi:uncharacterized protein GlcG (DUF336 family)
MFELREHVLARCSTGTPCCKRPKLIRTVQETGRPLAHPLAMGGGVPLTSDGQVVAGVGVSGGTVEQDVAIVEAAL